MLRPMGGSLVGSNGFERDLPKERKGGFFDCSRNLNGKQKCKNSHSLPTSWKVFGTGYFV